MAMRTPESIGLATIVPLEIIRAQAADPSPFQTLIEKAQQAPVLALLEPTNTNLITPQAYFGFESNPFWGGVARGFEVSFFTYWTLLLLDQAQYRLTGRSIPERFKLGATLISNIAAATLTRFNEVGIGLGIGSLLEPAPTQLAAAGVIAGICSYAVVHLLAKPLLESNKITRIIFLEDSSTAETISPSPSNKR